LVRLGDDPPNAGRLADAAAQRNVPFDIVDLADPKLIELYQRRLILVRPDGHVAWRDDAVPRDALGLIDRVRGAAH
jgi:hypothetical protein